MISNPPCAHVITIHSGGGGGKAGSTAHGTTQARELRTQLAVTRSELEEVTAQRTANADSRAGIGEDRGRLNERVRLADRRVQYCECVKEAGLIGMGVGALGASIGSALWGLREEANLDPTGQEWALSEAVAGAGFALLGMAGAGGAWLATRHLAAEQARDQTELDRLANQSQALTEQGNTLSRLSEDLMKRDRDLTHALRRCEVATAVEGHLPAVCAALVVDYLGRDRVLPA